MPHMDDWNPLETLEPPKYVTISGGKIRIFSMDEWNFVVGGKGKGVDEMPTPPKILHYKGKKGRGKDRTFERLKNRK